MELFEIRILVAAEDGEEGDLILNQIGDLLTGAVGNDRYGAVLFEGVNPNGTEVPEGFAAADEGGLGAEATFSASGHKTEDDYDDTVEGAPV